MLFYQLAFQGRLIFQRMTPFRLGHIKTILVGQLEEFKLPPQYPVRFLLSQSPITQSLGLLKSVTEYKPSMWRPMPQMVICQSLIAVTLLLVSGMK